MFDKYNEYMSLMEKDKSEHTLRSYRTAIEPFLNHFNICSSDDIAGLSRADIVAYRNTISGKASTINARMRPLKAFIYWLIEWGYLVVSRDKKEELSPKALSEEKKVPLILTDKECDAMIKACKKGSQTHLMMVIMFKTGARVAEITNMKVSHIENDGENVRILIHGKGNKERKTLLREDVVELLSKYLETHNDEYIFSSQKGGGKISTEAIRMRIKKIAGLAGIDANRVGNITPHSTRRYFATSLVDDGHSINVIQSAMGHADYQTTLRYAKVRNATVDNAISSSNRIDISGD